MKGQDGQLPSSEYLFTNKPSKPEDEVTLGLSIDEARIFIEEVNWKDWY